MDYRDEVYFEAQPDREQPFSDEEFANRLTRIRQAMAEARIDCLFLSSPESMYYVAGYVCMRYHTESPMEWSATNGRALSRRSGVKQAARAQANSDRADDSQFHGRFPFSN